MSEHMEHPSGGRFDSLPPRGKEKVMDELKPCPFCGSTNIEVSHYDWRGYLAICEGCRGSTNYFFTREDAVEAWNRRQDEIENLQAKIAELEERNGDLDSENTNLSLSMQTFREACRELKAENAAQYARIEKLEDKIRSLKRRRAIFGGSR